MTEKKYSPEDWQRWRETLPRKTIFTGRGKGNLGQCKLCGNKYPLSPSYFMRSPGPEKVYGFIREGLLFVCLECEKNWGPDFKDDVNGLYAEALVYDQQGIRKTIKPIAKGAA